MNLIKVMRLLVLQLVWVGLVIIAAPAFSAEDAVKEMSKEEMVVTVRKREENLQNVPIAVGVLSSEDLATKGISSTVDVAEFIPSIQYDQGIFPQDTRIVMRGLSPSRGRQNVAVLLDGIDITSQAIQSNGGTMLINPRLFDAERVEVVKGPQNALYGRTAFAGAINYVSKQPTEEFEGRVGADVGSDGLWELKGNASGSLAGDTLLGIVSGAVWNHDGFYSDSTTGQDVGGYDGYAISGALTWNVTDRISIKPRIDWTDDSFESTAFAIQDPGAGLQPLPDTATQVQPGFAAPVLAPFVPNPYPAPSAKAPSGDSLPVRLAPNPRTGNVYPGTEREILRTSLIMDFDFDVVTLTSSTQLAQLESTQFEDANRNGDPADPANFGKAGADGEFWADETRDLFSQDLRLAGDHELYQGGALNWNLGFLYWKEETDFDDGSITCLIQDFTVLAPGTNCGDVLATFDNGAGSNPRNPYRWEQESRHWSVYGLVDWQIVESFNAIFELRYSDEKQTVSGPGAITLPRIVDPSCSQGGFCFFPLPPTINPQDRATDASGTAEDDYWAPKLTLQWNATDNAMAYVYIAQAYKPNGIAPLNTGVGPFVPENQRFDREEMTAYEIGTKTDWLDNELLLNAALFFQDYDKKQLSTQTTSESGLPTTRAINAAEAEVLGLELEAIWLPIEQLTLSVAYTYLDSEYKELRPLTSSASQIAAAGNCIVVDTPGTPAGTDPTCMLNLDGRQLEDAPEHSAVGFAGYRSQFLSSDMDWFLEGDVIYQDERFLASANSVKLDSYTLFNFRAGLGTEKWDVTAYVDNAFEDDTFRTGFENPDARFPGFPFNGSYIKPDERQWGLRANWHFGG